jgi:hypothetical protein
MYFIAAKALIFAFDKKQYASDLADLSKPVVSYARIEGFNRNYEHTHNTESGKVESHNYRKPCGKIMN